MALTSAQQNKIVQLLGYPGKTLDAGSILYDKVLADRLLNLNSDTEALVVSLLASITTVETQLGAAPARTISLQVGDIKINPDEIAALRRERKVLSREIAALVDVPYKGANSNTIGIVV